MSDDTIFGGAGDDTIFGGAGNDVIAGGTGADVMDGGAGIDRLSYQDATSRVVVDMLNGMVLGTFAAGDIFVGFENLEGGSADDKLLGDNSANSIFGHDDDDELQGRFGDDTLVGGAGADTLDGGGNNDTASYVDSDAAVIVRIFNGFASGGYATGDVFFKIDNLVGSRFSDELVGSFVDNILEGGAGADTLNGGNGTDTLSYASDISGVTVSLTNGVVSGGDGDGDVITNFENVTGGGGRDALTGDGGANVLRGMGGADQLNGLAGNDTLEGGAGEDTLDGGLGRDVASYSGAGSGVTVSLGSGAASGGDAFGDIFISIEGLYGSAFDDALTGDAGDNHIEGGLGADTLDGGDGIDTLSYASSNSRVVVDLLNGNTFLGHAEGDTISNFENLTGSRLPDYILGSHGANLLEGGRGIDRLEARGGDDTLIGGSQNDNLKGGAGSDVFVLCDGDGADVIADWQDGFDRIDLSDFALTFSSIHAASSELPIGAVLVDLGDGDSFQINDFLLQDFDAGDVIV